VKTVKLSGKVLLTGASGFVGGQLRERLTRDGAEVVTVRRKASKPGPGRSVEVEYDDAAALERLLADEKPDYLLHVAGATKGITYADFQHANVLPTRNLLEAAAKQQPALKRFVYVSSLTALGPNEPGKPHTESTERKPIEFYGQSKAEAEQVVESFTGKVGWSIVRPGGVFGPGDVDYFNLFKEVSKGRNVFFGNRKRAFSAVYVDDLIDAILLCALREEAAGKTFILGWEEPQTWEGFQQVLVEQGGRKVMTIDLPEFFVGVAAFFGELATRIDKKPRLFNQQKAKMGAQPSWVGTSEAAKKHLGWEPKLTVPEAVARTFSWYRENKWL
jgi:nucleoside-diphosphate-sugar epimerase